MRYPVRCRICGTRKTLRRHPADYLRKVRCSCGYTGYPEEVFRVDRYRQRVEWNVKPCMCDGYHFPHARGRGQCNENPKKIDARQQAHYETDPVCAPPAEPLTTLRTPTPTHYATRW